RGWSYSSRTPLRNRVLTILLVIYAEFGKPASRIPRDEFARTSGPPNKALHVTGPTLRFSETSGSLQPARQVNAVVRRTSVLGWRLCLFASLTETEEVSTCSRRQWKKKS